MADTTMIHVRVEEDLKVRATRALLKMALTVSGAVRVLLTRAASDQDFPFSVNVPNAETRPASYQPPERLTLGVPSPASWRAQARHPRFGLLSKGSVRPL